MTAGDHELTAGEVAPHGSGPSGPAAAAGHTAAHRPGGPRPLARRLDSQAMAELIGSAIAAHGRWTRRSRWRSATSPYRPNRTLSVHPAAWRQHDVARVVGDRSRERLHLHVTGLPLRPGYYEVWLITPDTSEMVSVGLLPSGGGELLPLPSTIDPRRYRTVDVPAEDYDGDVTDSGRSLLRGTLAE